MSKNPHETAGLFFLMKKSTAESFKFCAVFAVGVNMEQKNLVLISFHDNSLDLSFVVSNIQTNSYIYRLKIAMILQTQ